MPVIRIKEKAHTIAEKEAKKQDRSITWIASEAIEYRYSRPNPKLKEKKVHPYFAKLKEIYYIYWQKYNGFEYRWNGAVDAQALNRLIKSLEAINESDNTIEDLFKIIMDKLPNFYKDKSINAINKNLSTIIAEIKNGNKQSSKGWDNIPEQFDWRK